MEYNQFHTPPPPPPAELVTTQAATQETYNYAADLLMNKKIKAAEVRNMLMQQGLDAQSASTVISSLEVEITKQKRVKAKRDTDRGIRRELKTIFPQQAKKDNGGLLSVNFAVSFQTD